MGLLDTLNKIKQDGFDAKNDNVSKSSRLEPGTYPVRLKSVQAGISQSGQDQISIVLEVVSGKEKDRLEIIYMSFDEKLPEFVLEKNGRMLLKIAAMTDVTFTTKDLDDEYSTATALEKGVGRQFVMKLTTSENKKNPAYPYRNYEFSALESPKENDFDEDNLPF